MNFYKLYGRLDVGTTQKGKVTLYIPRDPYRIFTRLAKMVFKNEKIQYREYPQPVDLFTCIYSECPQFESKLDSWAVNNFWFLRWIHQELPKDFWKYNVNIDVCKKEIFKSAKTSREQFLFETWIDMPGKTNKIKKSPINQHLLIELRERRLVVPSYDEIVDQMKGWGNDTKYCYGKIKEVQSALQI